VSNEVSCFPTAETCRGDGYVTTHYFCEGLSLCSRHGYFRRDDRDYVLFCFADAADAELFRERFNGEMVLKRSLIERRTAERLPSLHSKGAS
jgi:hypothetical protein